MLSNLSNFSEVVQNVQIGILAQVDNTNGAFSNLNKRLFLYYGIDSLVVTGTIKAEVPTNVEITDNNGTMELTWDAVADATQYYVYRSTIPDAGYQEIGTTGNNSFSDDLTTLDKGLYYYKIVSEVAQKIYDADRNGLVKQRGVKK